MFFAGLMVGALVAGGERSAAAEADGGSSNASSCVQVSTEARYVPFGYNHLVNLQNGCTKVAVCRVSTDVSPAPVQAEVPVGQRVTVQTFAGSPAQSFVAKVDCALR